MSRFSRRKHDSYGFRNRRTFGSILSAPFRFLFDRFVGDADSLGGQVPLQTRIVRGVGRLLFFPIFCVWQVLQFVILSWTTTRSIHAFLWGLLPLLIAISIVGLAIVWPFVEVRFGTNVHRTYTISAEADGEFQAGLLGSKRVQLLTREAKYRFIHAMSLEKAGLVKNANAILLELATFQKDCYIPAHMYLVGQYLAEYDKDNTKTDLLEKALKHIEQVNSVETNMQAQVYEGLIKMGLGRVDEAMEIFKIASADYPTVVPQLAAWLLERGETELASLHIQRGLSKLFQIAELNPNDPAIWQTMFNILIVKEDYSQAIAEFDRAFSSVESPLVKVQLRTLQSNIMIEFCKKFEDDNSVDGLGRQLTVMSQAISFNPRSPPALERFINLVLYSNNPEFEAWIADDARDDIVSDIFHLMNGMRNAITGNPELAKKQLRLALGDQVVSQIVVYDIARVIANTNKKPEDALLLLNVAVESLDNPVLNCGRGDILMTLGRNSEALTELEYAAELIPNDPYVFEVLAKCRDALGDKSGAAEAQERAEEIRTERMASGILPSKEETP